MERADDTLLDIRDLTVQPDHIQLLSVVHPTPNQHSSPTGSPHPSLLAQGQPSTRRSRRRCTTQSEANDVVVDYDLSGYAKNALTKYVPQLTTTYDASELHDDHPVRFTTEGLRLDHKPENTIEWSLTIPHHEDSHLWMPAQSNPEQRGWLEALNASDAEMCERDGTWYLHVTATRDVAERSEVSPEERTPIGLDIGEASLVTVCHRDEHGCPTAPALWADEAKTVRRLPKRYFTATRRLQTRGSEPIVESVGDEVWSQRDDIFHTVTREVVEYTKSVENPVLVLEDLTDIRESMDDGA